MRSDFIRTERVDPSSAPPVGPAVSAARSAESEAPAAVRKNCENIFEDRVMNRGRNKGNPRRKNGSGARCRRLRYISRPPAMRARRSSPSFFARKRFSDSRCPKNRGKKSCPAAGHDRIRPQLHRRDEKAEPLVFRRRLSRRVIKLSWLSEYPRAVFCQSGRACGRAFSPDRGLAAVFWTGTRELERYE